jgi:ribose 5-phosphate isomerase A
MMDERERYKQLVGEYAAAMVESNTVIGLGTGSTATYFVAALGERLRTGSLRNIMGVPTSERTAAQARREGVPLTDLHAHPALAAAFDGADEIDPHLGLIKGLGGALLREKIVASSAATFFVFGDSSKMVKTLGVVTPVPVEIVDFARPLCIRRLQALGAKPVLRQRDGAPVITDEGHVILDAFFDGISDPDALNQAILAIPGVVDTGLFLHMATAAFVAGPGGVEVIHPA